MTRAVADEGLVLGGEAPAFRDLLGADGKRYSLESFRDADVLVVVFLSNGCPTVRGYDERLMALQHDFAGRVQIVGVNSNNPYLSPTDTYAEMVERARDGGYKFPYIKDEDSAVARRFGAVSTPHAFVFDEGRRLRYRGRIDDARNPATVENNDLRDAVTELLYEGRVSVPETQPFGCAVVW